jgi:hypothetical protein
MTSTATVKTTKRPSAAARRTGYVFAVLVNAALLLGINVWPEWDVLPFLSNDFSQVLVLVNVTLVVSVVANVVYLFKDTTRVKSLGDVVTLSVGLAAMVQIWQVFPFDFGGSTFDWSLVFRIFLGLGIVGSAIAIVVALVSLVTGRPSQS